MTYVIAAIALLWMFRIFVDVISWSHLWWVKEYRWDRMFIHLSTAQAKYIYVPPLKKPRLSPKSITLIVVTLGTLGILIVKSGLPILWSLFVADAVSFPITFLVVGLLYMPTFVYHSWIIYRARRILRSHKKLFVIGITGSFGKTSTKEYLSTILSQKFPTLKTEASKNAPIGIAEIVVSKLTEVHEMFVVEMGAYKKGEVSFMTHMVRPQVGIVTAINAQHQDLFGSIENTMHAKYELLANLTGKRIAILNADNDHVRTMGAWAKRDGLTIWWYGTASPIPDGAKTFLATDITDLGDTITFVCRVGTSKAKISVKLTGTHQAQNVLAAIAAAVASGMTLKEAAKAAASIHPVSHMIEKIPGAGGLQLIDDTFNNNPDAAKAALAVLKKSQGKKFFVFQPMIELGGYANAAHEEVGAYAAEISDEIVLTNSNWIHEFTKGAEKSKRHIPIHIASGREAAMYIRSHAHSGDTVLGKGREAASVIRLLKRN